MCRMLPISFVSLSSLSFIRYEYDLVVSYSEMFDIDTMEA